ncbi:MAG: helicase-exonuclease AddAB subunit AddA [Lachnospiraceae bacterium]|nr:helicase-exonuclease AddAB subunit AddA [Candidatus Darwinimomas equi]
MADNKWTSEQLKAIETHDRRLLVSAAAGSGKTAVLVERIIRRILDPEDPVDVDRFLVITFTRAAASEMKDRIRRRLEETYAAIRKDRKEDDGLLRRLKSQIAIMDSACIQTIDSFCMNVVRDHTDELEIDPNFRVAEETELKLMQADVMESMLEDCYEKAEDDFIAFIDAFGQGNAGNGIEEKILQIYRFAQVTPDPEVWYSEHEEDRCIDKTASYVHGVITGLAESVIPSAEKLLAVCMSDNGPSGYADAISSDIEKLEQLARAEDFRELNEALQTFEFKRLGRNKTGTDRLKIDALKSGREEIKKTVESWKKNYSREDISMIEDEYRLTEPFIRTGIGLAREFDRRYSQQKREKNVVDFGDVEHMALKVLKLTDEYRERFREICVDEYQDTNYLQEEIVRRLDAGQVFMVGDVKQSIYKFRQARPEIFMDKYRTFIPVTEADPSSDTLINLSMNFRSRPDLLEDINRLFRVLMHRELGGIDYTPEAELNPGARFGTPEEERDNACDSHIELLLVNVGSLDAEDSARAAEARMIASKIRELTDPENGMKIWNGREYRQVRLSDIVILLRSANVSGEAYLNTLLNAGIPAHCETNKGYFDSLEIRTMTAMLTAVDNPKKDIAYTAFLRSPVIGMTDDELVVLRKQPDMLSDIGRYKYERACAMLKRYRDMSRYTGIEDLITKIYDETGYYEYAMSLPAGKVRRANLDKLRQMAAEYAQTGYRGLFNFIRYIDNLKTYDADFGEASISGENDNAVRIMSIHKSKGLEFPVVFLAACDKKLNQMDSNQPLLIDDDLGIACPYTDVKERFRQKTLKQMALRLKLRNDTVGEELRILYVAMTRAKEKLFIAGAVKDEDKFVTEYDGIAASQTVPGISDIKNDSGYLYWIRKSGVNYRYTIYDTEEVTGRAGDESLEKIREHLDTVTVDADRQEKYSALFDFSYPYQSDVSLRNKISISELKRQWMADKLKEDEITGEYAVGEAMFSEKNGTDGQGESGAQKDMFSGDFGGAQRGTLYHSVMEKLDYTDPETALKNLPEDVRPDDIRKFIESDFGKMFRDAQRDGRLFRECRFIMGIPAGEIGAADSDEPVLVQGIIDAFVMSEDGRECILVDYKTDRVSDEQELIDRYEGQLHYYVIALEKMRSCRVTRKIIWSFALGKAIGL